MAAKNHNQSNALQIGPFPQDSCPATRLSPEILSRIFMYIARPWPRSPEKFPLHHDTAWLTAHTLSPWGDDSRTDRAWLRILRVCRQWRHAALSCPLLWVNIDTTIRTLKSFMLQKSSPAKISLGPVRIEKDKSEVNKRQVFDNLRRMRRLALAFNKCSDEEKERMLTRVLSRTEAPHLTLLKLETGWSAGDPIAVPAPQPSLTSLALVETLLSFPQGSKLTKITELSLKIYNLLGDTDNVDWFDETLGQMPNLLRLYIHDEGRTPIHPRMKISLKRLQELHFIGSSHTFSWLWQHLTLPSTTRYHLVFDDAYTDTESLYDTFDRILRTYVDRDTKASRYHVKFSMTMNDDDGEGSDDISIRTMILATPSMRGTKPLAIPVITVEHPIESWDWVDMGYYLFHTYLSRVMEQLPTDAVQDIHIRSNMPFRTVVCGGPRSPWGLNQLRKPGAAMSRARTQTPSEQSPVSGFLTCTGVQTLHLEGFNPIAWMSMFLALTSTTDAYDLDEAENHGDYAKPSSFAVFPHLERLVLSNIDWAQEFGVWDLGYKESKEIPPILRSIRAALGSRARRFGGKSRLKSLKVTGEVPDWWVKDTREGNLFRRVGGFEWDQKATDKCDWGGEEAADEDDEVEIVDAVGDQVDRERSAKRDDSKELGQLTLWDSWKGLKKSS